MPGNSQLPNLGDGDIDGARASFDAALDILEPLRAPPRKVAILHALGRVSVRRAEAAAPGEGAGPEPGLIAHLGEGVAMLRAVVEAGGGSDTRLNLAHALIMDPGEPQCEGEHETLLARGREALAIVQDLAASHPAEERIAHELAVTRGWYGSMLVDRGLPREALVEMGPALDWLEAHCAARPLDARAALDRARVGGWWGWALEDAGRAEEGLACVAAAIELAAHLAQANPDDQRFVRQCEASTSMLARLHATLGEQETRTPAERMAHFARAAALYHKSLAMLAQRTERGWTLHSEGHYEQMYAAAAQRAEARREVLALRTERAAWRP